MKKLLILLSIILILSNVVSCKKNEVIDYNKLEQQAPSDNGESPSAEIGDDGEEKVPPVKSKKGTRIAFDIEDMSKVVWKINENPSEKDGTFRQKLIYDNTVTIEMEKFVSEAKDIHDLGEIFRERKDIENARVDYSGAMMERTGYLSFDITYDVVGEEEKTNYDIFRYIIAGKYSYTIRTSLPKEKYDDFSDMLAKFIYSIELTNG